MIKILLFVIFIHKLEKTKFTWFQLAVSFLLAVYIFYNIVVSGQKKLWPISKFIHNSFQSLFFIKLHN